MRPECDLVGVGYHNYSYPEQVRHDLQSIMRHLRRNYIPGVSRTTDFLAGYDLGTLGGAWIGAVTSLFSDRNYVDFAELDILYTGFANEARFLINSTRSHKWHINTQN